MPGSQSELEADVARFFASSAHSGSVCAVVRRCGKAGCQCAKPDDAGHDPQVRLTRRANWRTIAESIPTPAAWRKAQTEIDEYHRLQKLNAELIELNEKISKLRPLASN